MIFGLFLYIFLDFLDELLQLTEQLHVTKSQFLCRVFKHFPHRCKCPMKQIQYLLSHSTNKTENVLNMICGLTPLCVYSLNIRFIHCSWVFLMEASFYQQNAKGIQDYNVSNDNMIYEGVK